VVNRIHARDIAPACDPAMAMIGDSEILRRARRLLLRYARCDAPVLIEGETGTGKELAAREIHYASARRLGPFVPVNCGALPESLLESELFGHRRGAFTDARSDEPGLIEYARGGTLFLDEVDSLPPRAQTTLLRFLQSGEFRAVGARTLLTADVRVLAATNIPLADAVESGQFRRDLLYRLNALQISLPPLRERGDDIALLARHLLATASARLEQPPRRWAPEAIAALSAHGWPGNVRELENVILRVCMRSDADIIDLAELAQAEPSLLRADAAATASAKLANGIGGHGHASGDARDDSGHDAAHADEADVDEAHADETSAGTARSAFTLAKQRAIAAFERRYLTELMRRAGGNVSRAALLSGTERRQLGKMLKRHGIGHGPPPTA
jgi:DNA-binding NtrC family response regulator